MRQTNLVSGRALKSRSDLLLKSAMKAIKARRTELQISQEALAEAVGVSRSSILNYEYDKNYPSLETLAKLCVILNLKFAIEEE